MEAQEIFDRVKEAYHKIAIDNCKCHSDFKDGYLSALSDILTFAPETSLSFADDYMKIYFPEKCGG